MILHPIRRRDATGLVARVYDAIEDDFFLAPPLVLHSPSPPLLAATWTAFREVMLCGGAPRPWKEAAATAVARANRCPFCVQAHAMFLHGLGAHADARWLATRPEAPPPAGELAAVVEWASAVRTPEAPILRNPPFGARWAADLIATAMLFQYVTTMATVFLDSTPIPRGFRWMSGTVRRVGGAVLSSRLDRRLPPGRSLGLLPEAPLPADLSWAASDPHVAGALARWTATLEEAGGRALPPSTRARIVAAVEDWRGETLPLGNAWIDRVLDREPEPAEGERPLSRLALLAALAPERIAGRAIQSLLAAGVAERVVLEAVAWGAFTTARRVATWMRGPC